MHDNQTLSFASAASLSIPQGTRTHVKALLDADGAPRIATGTNAYGRWMRLDFEVVQGDYAGRQAAMMLTFDPRDRDFRAAVSTITGLAIAPGLTVSMSDIRSALKRHEFRAELGPQRRGGRETGYTNVYRLIGRV